MEKIEEATFNSLQKKLNKHEVIKFSACEKISLFFKENILNSTLI